MLRYAFIPGLIMLCLGTLSAQKSKALFNQENLSGWYAFSKEDGKLEHAEDLFRVSDQMIHLYGPKAGYLMSQKSFREFVLKAEFRWNTDTTFSRKSSKKNSGLMYLVPKSAKDTLWPQGIQFQIKEGATGDFILLQHVTLEQNGTRNQPGPSVVVKRTDDAEKEAGQWNQIEIRVENGEIKQLLNGKLVNEGRYPSVTKGRILLQYEGYPIDFRNIEIQKL
ncbi:DUF1080 domain-containing protein [Mangrovibacterium marinum]|uniref:Uncharacterized protein DUF1080 n=1 Tax=Mangrovibacterium marinum TaxID=1639118 RepID=A0A2T5C4F3_9BACT|nr:DUF1080 domain-containing protein [Mangrovibacterium marinum]PTN09736.1 uncharacterized protein DUF1080 [Mangrovibacterium marinum]